MSKSAKDRTKLEDCPLTRTYNADPSHESHPEFEIAEPFFSRFTPYVSLEDSLGFCARQSSPIRHIFCTCQQRTTDTCPYGVPHQHAPSSARGLLYLRSTTALDAVLSTGILGMYTSYLLPIIFTLVRRCRKPTSIPGVFRLGHIGGYITNIVSVFWLILAMNFRTFPSHKAVNAQDMSYSVVVMSGWLVFGVVYYYTGGNHRYVESSKVAIF